MPYAPATNANAPTPTPGPKPKPEKSKVKVKGRDRLTLAPDQEFVREPLRAGFVHPADRDRAKTGG